MAKILDLNALEQPILELTMRDEKKTIFRLTTPTTKLVERFIAAKAELADIAQSGNVEKIQSLYAITADIISCNLDFVKVTAEDLKDKYGVKLGDIIVIFTAYVSFINEYNSAKN